MHRRSPGGSTPRWAAPSPAARPAGAWYLFSEEDGDDATVVVESKQS
jgi:hypothetical protein